MKLFRASLAIVSVVVCCQIALMAQLQRPETNFKIFQFPADKIPTIDGKTDDWAIVPESYSIGMDQLKDTVNNHPMGRKDLDVKVKVRF